MKYEEVEHEFVNCERMDANNKCGEIMDDGVCVKCIENYEELKDGIIDDFIADNPKRDLIDFMEVSRDSEEKDESMLRFGLWSVLN